ncbi:MAG: hypothetical protein LBK99_02630 [Opitutaceae bacterium]|jgi:hypothetical protein|nr:hypothetical protein [Opitutaceae bacterium]
MHLTPRYLAGNAGRAWAFACMLVLPRLLFAETLLSENWEGYSNGATPSGWAIWSGSTPGAVGSVTVTDTLHSPFEPSGTNSVLIAGIAESGPSFSYHFSTTTTSALSIGFDFYLPSTGAGVLPSFGLGNSSGTSGIMLNLTNAFVETAPNIVNQGASWNTGDVITSSQTNKWFHVEIIAPPATVMKQQYTITVTPDGGNSVTVSALNFRNAIDDYGRINFSWNSTNGTGSMYIDNIVITAIPEPATAALFVLIPAALFAWLRRRNRI